jgi:hypothetical protein
MNRACCARPACRRSPGPPLHGAARAPIAPLAALAGLLLSGWIFYIGGEILLEITARLQQTMEQGWLPW